jgi:putative oxidoreductase
VLTRITAAIFIIEMIGATLIAWLSPGFAGGPLLKQAEILVSLLSIAISISLLLTGPGRISVEWDMLRREVFPRGARIIQHYKDSSIM